MKKLILASNNKKKINELKEILKDLNLDIKCLKDENIDIDVIEDGETFEENSFKKAKEIKDFLIERGDRNFLVMADDSGLEVDYLNGEPGIYSARYAGSHGDDKKNNEKLLKNLKNVKYEDRKARFVCQITVIDSIDNKISVRGEVEGFILEELKGQDGFGYDPLFYYGELENTFAQLTMEEKNKISHRGTALLKLRNELKNLI